MTYAFSISTTVKTDRRAVWERISTFEGVNDELYPLARMTHPKGRDRLDPRETPIGTRIFRSWILVLGALPFDYDDITFLSLTPDEGFHECSVLGSAKRWVHRRELADAPDGGCTIKDSFEITPRVALFGWLSWAMFVLTFKHRHRRLVRRFGAGAA